MMPWLLLLLALAALAVAFLATSIAVVLLCLAGAFGFAMVAVMQLLADRLERARGDAGELLPAARRGDRGSQP